MFEFHCVLYMITCRYYEFEVLVPGKMKVGWAKMSLESGKELGTDGNSFVFDGFSVSIRSSLYVCTSLLNLRQV